jgi:polyisoprenoid-binding protein YceI
MKFKSTIMLLALGLFVVSCGGEEKEEEGEDKETTEEQPKPEETPATLSGELTVNTTTSVINWEGKKMAYGHGGTLMLSAGTLNVEENHVKGGTFTIDMASLVETGNDNAEDAAKLAGHLKSPDFFSVDSFPTATLVITDATASEDGMHTFTGDLTIKSITKSISFTGNVSVEGETLKANAEFMLDRAQWGITFGSVDAGAPEDQAIMNDVSMQIMVMASK